MSVFGSISLKPACNVWAADPPYWFISCFFMEGFLVKFTITKGELRFLESVNFCEERCCRFIES